MPAVSIIITSFNYDKYIGKCVLSCINQNGFNDYEVIVIDDGSTDNTSQILKNFENKTLVYFKENGGIENASNYGIRQAKGDYIVRVDADDKLDPDFLKSVFPMISNSDYAFIYPEYFVIDQEDKILSHKKLPDFDILEIKNRGDFLATGTMFNKEILYKIGLYNETTRNCGLENYELILHLLESGFKGLCLHKHLFYYRQHGSNISLTRRESIINYGKKLAKIYKLSEYNTNQNHPWGLKLF